MVTIQVTSPGSPRRLFRNPHQALPPEPSYVPPHIQRLSVPWTGLYFADEAQVLEISPQGANNTFLFNILSVVCSVLVKTTEWVSRNRFPASLGMQLGPLPSVGV